MSDPAAVPNEGRAPRSVLFMCGMNSIRSPMAEVIAKRLVAALKPKWLRIGGYWYPRGGMPIDVFFQTGAPPQGLFLPDQGVPPYRGRG